MNEHHYSQLRKNETNKQIIVVQVSAFFLLKDNLFNFVNPFKKIMIKFVN